MRFTLSKKLFGGFAVVLLLLTVTVAISYSRITAVDNEYSKLIDDKAKKLILIQELGAAIKKEQLGIRGYLILGDDESMNAFNTSHENYLKLSENLGNIIKLPKAKELLNELDELEQQFYQVAAEEAKAREQNQTEEYLELVINQGHDITQAFDNTAAELTAYQQNVLDEGNEATSAQVQSIKNWVLFLGLLAIAAGTATAFYIGRLITKPVQSISEAARKIANGDLTTEVITVRNKDEIGELAASFNQMTSNLRELIYEVETNAEHVAASSEELTASAEQTAVGSEQIATAMSTVAAGVDKQFKAVEEASSTINEMSIGVREIAANTQSASNKAIDAYDKASSGSDAIRIAVGQMNSIQFTFNDLSEAVLGLGTRSTEISQIIGVITEIASQTNLLALNAAIEAARAGENGRGFAIVAAEVRKLAEQSALSAQQISELITSIQGEAQKAVRSMEIASKEVMAGLGVVHTAGDSFEQIQESVNLVSSQVQEISSSIQQLAAGTEQMAHSMSYITEVSEGTASSAQEVSASAEEQLATMKEISEAANSSSLMAEKLQILLKKFEL
ncbi:methyl-accepting chemotaxis protein [Paenibacillus pinistramenti]|uniref:methyl-accepting chemotaxis protein n=1 Tax=Paenibacillus pinistramenti TaxID=1768003 RepID=UPI0011090CB4|nr:HAMP domain-containing methyl-accepting chemotaxis protein [Paenibacillus pinistramenti]